MALIVCHGPKGGSGTTFISAHLAIGLAEAGADVTVLTIAARDTMPLHFGLPPSLAVPSLTAPSEDGVDAGGVDLRQYRDAAEDPDFVPMLRELGYLDQGRERVMVIDVPAGEHRFAQRLVPNACAHVCPIHAQPDTLALLPQVFEDAGEASLAQTAIVINALDETRRLSRHGAAFIRELVENRLVGRVRLDESVPEAIAMLQPLARYAPASAALADVRKVAAAIVPTIEGLGTSEPDPQDESRAA